jgi:hypothetical protein
MPVPGGKADDLDRMEPEWNNRLTYPTGLFNPAWVRVAAARDALIQRAIPLGIPAKNLNQTDAALTLNPNSFTSLGPKPKHITAAPVASDYVTTEGRSTISWIRPLQPIALLAALYKEGLQHMRAPGRFSCQKKPDIHTGLPIGSAGGKIFPRQNTQENPPNEKKSKFCFR